MEQNGYERLNEIIEKKDFYQIAMLKSIIKKNPNKTEEPIAINEKIRVIGYYYKQYTGRI